MSLPARTRAQSAPHPHRVASQSPEAAGYAEGERMEVVGDESTWSQTKKIAVAALVIAVILGLAMSGVSSAALVLARNNEEELDGDETGQNIFTLLRAETIEVHELNGMSTIGVGDDMDLQNHSIYNVGSLEYAEGGADPVVWVDSQNGNDAWPGTHGEPLRSIGAAFTLLAGPGFTGAATIMLATGLTYDLGANPVWSLEAMGLASLDIVGVLPTAIQTFTVAAGSAADQADQLITLNVNEPLVSSANSTHLLVVTGPVATEPLTGESAWTIEGNAGGTTILVTATESTFTPNTGSSLATYVMDNGVAATIIWSGMWTVNGAGLDIRMQRLVFVPADAGHYIFNANVHLIETRIVGNLAGSVADASRNDHWGSPSEGLAGVSFPVYAFGGLLGHTPRDTSELYRCTILISGDPGIDGSLAACITLMTESSLASAQQVVANRGQFKMRNVRCKVSGVAALNGSVLDVADVHVFAVAGPAAIRAEGGSSLVCGRVSAESVGLMFSLDTGAIGSLTEDMVPAASPQFNIRALTLTNGAGFSGVAHMNTLTFDTPASFSIGAEVDKTITEVLTGTPRVGNDFLNIATQNCWAN